MRLICPNCAAQYEVADDAVPPEGRDVECSACGTGWRQPGMPPLRLAGAARKESPETSADLPRPSASVLAVLREEATREIAAREAERSAPERPQDAVPSATSFEATPPRGTLPSALPDPARLAASLTWQVQDPPEAQAQASRPAAAATSVRSRRRSGYAAGFNTAAAIAALLVAVYAAAPRFAHHGTAGAQLMQARAAVDRGRLALQAEAERLTDSAIAFIR